MVNPNDIELGMLPGSLAEVADAVGLSAALALVLHAGGTRVYVPEELDSTHRLVHWLGIEAAERLADLFGGETLDVPRCQAGARAVRDRRIREQRHAGTSIRDLALRYQLTERQVYTIIASQDGDQAQARQQTLL